jgi:hypothetical protein
MSDFIKDISARQLIEMIANEYIELSNDKVRLQRDDHIKWCKQWLEQKECNGFCGEYECKENQSNCKRINK